jgi:hypothetical protein
MSDQWPPPVPGVKKEFKKAHDAATEKTVAGDSSKMVSKMQIRELEKQRKKPAPQLNLLSSEKKLNIEEDKKRERDIQRMKQRLRQTKGNTRDDFGRSV